MAESFDYIVVGAGSAGCVLANRLSEDPGVSVCLLEAGPPDRSPFIHVPLGVIFMMTQKSVNWLFQTAPEGALNGRAIPIPRGRVLGGSSSINGMVYHRGHPTDYDEWAEAGNPGWGWREVKPYFLKSEHNEQFADEHHGQGGPLNVTLLRSYNPLVEDFIASGEALQHRRVDDFCGDTLEGFDPHQVTQKNGRRWSTAKAFLEPVRGRKNLTVLTNAPVDRLTIAQGRAIGVEIGARRVAAKREVILAAGAILSPKLLLLSGIGNAGELARHGVPLAHHLPGVGRNLQEHTAVGVLMETESLVSYGISLPVLPRLAKSVLDYAFRRTGLFASNSVEAAAFLRSSSTLAKPDIKLTFMPGYRPLPPKVIGYGHGYALMTSLMHPKSRGRISLASADPAAPPVIDGQFFADPEDLETLLRGFKEARRVVHGEAFAKHRPREMLPGPDVRSDDAMRAYIRRAAATSFHPAGTCKMGPASDPAAVVDARLRVHGIKGIRVIDASIMPTICGGNPNAPTIMIGEKGADMIKEDARTGGV